MGFPAQASDESATSAPIEATDEPVFESEEYNATVVDAHESVAKGKPEDFGFLSFQLRLTDLLVFGFTILEQVIVIGMWRRLNIYRYEVRAQRRKINSGILLELTGTLKRIIQRFLIAN